MSQYEKLNLEEYLLINFQVESVFATIDAKFWKSIHQKSIPNIERGNNYLASERHIDFATKYADQFYVIPSSFLEEISRIFLNFGRSIFLTKSTIQGDFKNMEADKKNMITEIKIFGKKIKREQISNFIKFSAKIGLILLILVSMFLLCHSVLLSPDDYNYTFVQGTYMQKKVDSLENALETAKYFYNNWTGRVIPHVLIGIFRNLNELIYEIVNSFVFIIFIIMITKVLNKKSTFLSLLSVFGYLTFSRMFGEKFGWISGSFNYLWPSTFLIIFIYYF